MQLPMQCNPLRNSLRNARSPATITTPPQARTHIPTAIRSTSSHIQLRYRLPTAFKLHASREHRNRSLATRASSVTPGSGAEAMSEAGPEGLAADSIRVHYQRVDKRHLGFGLHVWGAAAHPTEWLVPMKPTGLDDNGCWWDIKTKGDPGYLGVLVYKGEQKAAEPNFDNAPDVNIKSSEATLELSPDIREIWLVGDERGALMEKPDLDNLPAGSIAKQASLWSLSDTIVWRQAAADPDGKPRQFQLHYSASASLKITGKGVEGADEVFDLTPIAGGTPKPVVARFPHLYGCTGLKLPEEAIKKSLKLMKGQLIMAVANGEGKPLDATGVQIQGALDDLTKYEGPLGYYEDEASGKKMISVWAPTATSVKLLRWDTPRGGEAEEVEMTEGVVGAGVWSHVIHGVDWKWSYYKFKVTVYCPWTRKVEVVEVADPYSKSLAADGDRSQIVDLDDPLTYPTGWVEHRGPPIAQWTDISLYELHIRDFSISDNSVPPALRGKYLAFNREATQVETHGQKHLAKLRASGLNHIHLLPAYDFGTVPEREEEQMKVQEDLSEYAPNGEQQQKAVSAIADQDGFNWGYDPVHWSVPEGSYATDPDGIPRIKEFRSMVTGLHELGYRVVLDVVYNHVFSSGPHDKHSVLDKIVPGYYLRRLEDGEICTSTCCNNTATEHFMCERLAVEDIVHWAKAYKVDGFRFDIMGHLMVSSLTKMRAQLDALTLERDGVDGRMIYLYGEAWDFGEVAGNQRGRNCGQMNLAGTKLGAFNDRLRDGALGGGPFAPHYLQGVVTGLALAPNSYPQGEPLKQLDELLYLTDMIRYSLAGNLRKYALLCKDGFTRAGEESQMHGLPLAYGAHPEENVAFIGCHDNQTLFDQISEKAPIMVLAEDRARMSAMSLTLIALSQGVPFFHAGDELLRSKSLDRDSYNSGDHFNRIDWTGADNNFGVGLPPATKNRSGWSYKDPLLVNTMIKPKPSHIQACEEVFRLMMRIRYSSPLFRMPSADHIYNQLHFHNLGPDQTPGVIVMEIASADTEARPPPAGPVRESEGGTVDPNYKRILVVFNCSPLEQKLEYPPYTKHMVMHSEQAAFDGVDAGRVRDECAAHDSIRMITMAPRTTGVFVELK